MHTSGGFYIAVTLGAKSAEIAENPQIGVVLRVAVMGGELAGPQHDAPAVAKKADKKGDSAARADSNAAERAGWSGTGTAAVAGGALVVVAGLVLVLVRRRRAAGAATVAHSTTESSPSTNSTDSTRRSA
ncbi:hypothetical protein SLUN_20065 [Streptomyces lunaelactis]|uniref:Uncharacterized protein n=1 Tax=Streptomyces lunaelactis TaxID=1535768 RepID=A0A2R4T4W9_9ACTN|nr:hypothetical protein [Streptomyces lunaelactis]AVZ74117.1 hypothetical protein SLUN_20065 [Streptomyces lunaelactis]NUK89362.1 hypothetical protein [Streptomyces lunaelactis]NUL07173.1 hypothetical protein [Streptomyces lunaelactis]